MERRLRQGWLSKPSGKVCGTITGKSITLPPSKPFENRHFGSEQPKGRREHNADGAEPPSLPSRAGRDGFPSRPGKGAARSREKLHPPAFKALRISAFGRLATKRGRREHNADGAERPSLPLLMPSLADWVGATRAAILRRTSPTQPEPGFRGYKSICSPDPLRCEFGDRRNHVANRSLVFGR